MQQQTIHLPENIARIIGDKAKRWGEPPAVRMRVYIIEHMLSTGEIFICVMCGAHCASNEMSDEKDVCVLCKAGV